MRIYIDKDLNVPSNVTNPAESDLDANGSPLNVKYHLEVIAYKPTFNDIQNKCSPEEAGTDITVTITVISVG